MAKTKENSPSVDEFRESKDELVDIATSIISHEGDPVKLVADQIRYQQRVAKMMDKPDYLPKKLNGLAKGWYRCTLCGYLYPEKDLVIHKESKQLTCKNCLKSLAELDQEQEDIENSMTKQEKDDLRDEEIKLKSGYFDKGGP